MSDQSTYSIKEVEDILTQVQRLTQEANDEQARALLLDVLKQDPNNPTVLAMLGGSYFCAKMYQEAELIFERLVLSDNGKGQYSIALFNTLWKLNRQQEALEEIKRFLSVANHQREAETVAEYMKIVKEMQPNRREDLD